MSEDTSVFVVLAIGMYAEDFEQVVTGFHHAQLAVVFAVAIFELAAIWDVSI